MAEQATAEARSGRRHVVCRVEELPPGGRLLTRIDGRTVGVFNVEGSFYALHNRCPHKGGALCEGPVCGTVLPTDDYAFPYGLEGRILRCAWHGWEFDITNGRAIAAPEVRARTYPVSVEGDEVVVTI